MAAILVDASTALKLRLADQGCWNLSVQEGGQAHVPEQITHEAADLSGSQAISVLLLLWRNGSTGACVQGRRSGTGYPGANGGMALEKAWVTNRFIAIFFSMLLMWYVANASFELAEYNV